MNIIYIVISALLLSSYLVNADQCEATVTAQPRKGGSWISDGISYQLYDIYVVNTGSCAFTTLFGHFGFPSTGRITESFNYNPSTGQISGFGASLAPQAVYSGAGFTLSGPVTPTVTFIRPTCPCTSPTLAPTSAPTSAPLDNAENCFNVCGGQEICARLSEDPFPRCHPRTCAALSCESNEVCISNGGLARCIVTSGTAAPTVAAEPTYPPTAENCFNVCTETEVCIALDRVGPKCHPRECKALSCNSTSICINNGGVARCIQTGAPPSTSAPTPDATFIPTSSATTTPTSSATAMPTPSATSAPTAVPPSSSCTVSVSIVKRPNGAYVQNGVPTQIYDLTLTSYSATTVNSISVVITPSAGASISQEWNLNSLGGNTYSVRTYGALTTQGATYHGAGFVVSGNSVTPAVAITGTTCA